MNGAVAAREALIFTLIERGTPVLLTGRAAPQQWPLRSPDLATRYRALLAFALGVVAAVIPARRATRVDILRAIATD